MVTATQEILQDQIKGLVFPWEPGQDPQPLIRREWLITNGLGGYASGSLMGISTRRYHGLLIPNLPAPHGRTVLIPRLDDELIVDGEHVLLNGSETPSGSIEGKKNLYLSEFRLEWLIPVWKFEIAGRVIERRILMPQYQNTVYLEYKLVKGNPISVQLRPYTTFRGHDAPLTHPAEWPFSFVATRDHHEIHPFEGAPTLRTALRPNTGFFVSDYKKSEVFYRVEKRRGLDHFENVISPGYYTFDLTTEKPVSFVASLEPWEYLEYESGPIIEAEIRRLQNLLSKAAEPLQHGLAAQLVLASDQFTIMPGSRMEEAVLYGVSREHLRTIIAGYHWFTDWGRDTMISLEGLCLCTGRYDEAKAILQTFAHYVKDGLLPNHFPEGAKNAIYNTIDATFWFFHALDRYLVYTGDLELLKQLYPLMSSIIDHHIRGTHFNIGVDPNDGLVKGGEEHYQLTWMDAKVEDWVVTPRRGKDVEIQAFWYNALRLMAEWSEMIGENSKEYFLHQAKKTFDSFNEKFWYEEGQYLYDVIDSIDVEDESRKDNRLRPNQIFTLALRYPVLREDRWQPVLEIVTKKLLTPYGLRTLDPAHKDYKPHYIGDRWARDAAYHQGLVWTWLLGPYVNAWMRVHKNPEEAIKILDAFDDHIKDIGVGTVSEIFDAEEPYNPGGCIAQAWSVSEILRIILMIEKERGTYNQERFS